MGDVTQQCGSMVRDFGPSIGHLRKLARRMHVGRREANAINLAPDGSRNLLALGVLTYFSQHLPRAQERLGVEKSLTAFELVRICLTKWTGCSGDDALAAYECATAAYYGIAEGNYSEVKAFANATRSAPG